MIQFIIAHAAIILGALLACSEVLALIPSIAANSVFQAFKNAIKFLMDQVKPKEAK